MIRFRIATYNVHKCRGIDWRVSPARIARVLQEIGADIIAVQEIFAAQAHCLAGALALPHVFGRARELKGDDYGNAVFTRFDMSFSHDYDLSVSRREPRRCLRVDLNLLGGAMLHLFAVHLGTSYFERRHQAAKLVSEDVLGDPKLQAPRLVTGDFNEWTRGLVTTTLSRHLRSADLVEHLRRSRTYPGVLPFLHLDHIYYDSPLHLSGLRLHRSAAALLASDHMPLVGDFTLPSPAAR
jgi:endonuclease/exonuclease/phosphatase family metal-dependent hydrolase